MPPIIAKGSKSQFKPAPEGLHQAVCCDAVDMGMRDGRWGEKHKVQLRFQLEAKNDETGKPFVVVSTYTLSLAPKAKLRQHLEAWRSRPFTETELEGFDLERLIGINCQVQIIHNLGEDGTMYGNINAIVPLGKGMTKMRVTDDYVRVKDRDDAKPAGEPEVNGDEEDPVPF